MVTCGSQVGNRQFQGAMVTGFLAMVPRLGTMQFQPLRQPEFPCNGNLWFPGGNRQLLAMVAGWGTIPTFGNREFLAMVTCGSHVGKHSEYQPLGTGSSLPWSKNKQVLLPVKQNKRFCYRLSKQNRTTLRTMSFNFLESTDPSTGNVCFFRFGTMSFKLSQPAIHYNDSCLASKT